MEFHGKFPSSGKLPLLVTLARFQEEICVQMPVEHDLMINTISDFDRYLPVVCEEVIRHLGAQNLESSYQKALKYELSQVGIDVLSEGICTQLTK